MKVIPVAALFALVLNSATAATIVYPESTGVITRTATLDGVTYTQSLLEYPQTFTVSMSKESMLPSYFRDKDSRVFPTFDLDALPYIDDAVLSFEAYTYLAGSYSLPSPAPLEITLFTGQGELSIDDFSRKNTFVVSMYIEWSLPSSPRYTHYERNVGELLREAKLSGASNATFRFRIKADFPANAGISVSNAGIVPEPTTTAMLALGTASVLLKRQRRA